MNILFRVDASSTMGVGHLMRCLALAQGLILNKHQVKFAILESSSEFCLSRQDWVGELVVVPVLRYFDEEVSWLHQYAELNSIDAFVLDGYQFDEKYRKALSLCNVPLVLFDDNNDSGPLHGDMVINGAENAADLGYTSSGSKVTLCLGGQYRVLRQEFVDIASELPLMRWHARQKLMIVMGGSDTQNLTLGLLQELDSVGFTQDILVATGGAYSHSSTLDQFLSRTRLSVEYHPNCQTIASLLRQSRLVISAAGGTQFEILACGTPAILLIVADNQFNATEQAQKQGWCETFDMRNDNGVKSLVARIISNWQSVSKLENQHAKARKHADVKGTHRVVRSLEQLVRAERD